MDSEWSLRSRIDQNPMSWMIQVNGFVVDARFLKREVQEDAVRQGLIPFVERQLEMPVATIRMTGLSLDMNVGSRTPVGE